MSGQLVIERYDVKGSVRRVCVGWWPESVLCCAVVSGECVWVGCGL
jgi:hypothetical protein